MPNGSTHDSITLTLATLGAGLIFYDTQEWRVAFVYAATTLISGLILSPDLDLHSESYIRFRTKWHQPVITLPADLLDGELIYWAMAFDDWDDCRTVGWREYRDRTGEDDRPHRPHPTTFTLKLSDFVVHPERL